MTVNSNSGRSYLIAAVPNVWVKIYILSTCSLQLHSRGHTTQQAVAGFFLAKFERTNILRILLGYSISSAPNRNLSGFKIYAVTFILINPDICSLHDVLCTLRSNTRVGLNKLARKEDFFIYYMKNCEYGGK